MRCAPPPGSIAAAISRERAEQALHRRDAILEAVSHAAELLVAATDWRDGADGLLERSAWPPA